MNLRSAFIEALRAVVETHGANTALLTEGKAALSYRELYERAGSFGEHLSCLGVQRETLVGICIEKSADYIATLLGVWFAGGAFLPLDPTLPPERLEFIVRDSGVKRVVARRDCYALFEHLDVECLFIDEHSELKCEAACPGVFDSRDSDLAYAIYTSGSTGEPKGVLVTHHGILNLMRTQICAFKLGPKSRALFYLSMAFDASISDIGTALLTGATLCIERPESLLPGCEFVAMLRERGITHMDIPPALLRTLEPRAMPASLETIIIGGEVCPPATVREWAAHFRIVNVYGPTEATICTSLSVCDENWDRPLIGQPIHGIEYVLLDETLDPAHGGEGELCVAGAGVARGYVNRPKLTAEKFIDWRGVRLYRTGDRVRRTSDGEFEFLGRIDRQFKWRGQLVEPAEIEMRLCEHPAVRRAAVLKRRIRPDSQREAIVAFVEPREGEQPSALELSRYLARSLPRWMVPARYEIRSELPVGPTGKMDFKALHDLPLKERRSAPNERTSASVESTILSNIWRDVLEREAIGIEDDFFERGGDSLNVIDAAAAANALGIHCSPSMIVKHRTIAKIVAAMMDSSSTQSCDGMSSDALRSDVKALLASHRVEIENLGAPGEKSGAVLLTGATGFLGSRVLETLLRKTVSDVYCVVRARDLSHARERILNAFSIYGRSIFPNEHARIIPLCGDIVDERFGLALDVWRHLSCSIESIFHCAAELNQLQEYEQSRRANVKGTLHVLRLMQFGRSKRLHHASSLSVFVSTNRRQDTFLESDELTGPCVVFGGYAQSKFAAEVLLRDREFNALDISIYRFGLLTGDSKTGIGNASDSLSMFIRGLVQLGCIPDARPELQLDMTPIDFAADTMDQLASNKQASKSISTYHIANGMKACFEDVLESLRSLGHRMAEVSRDEFTRRINECRSGTSSAVLALGRRLSGAIQSPDFDAMDLFQATGVRFDITRTLAGLECSGVECPEPSRDLLRRYWTRILERE